jgi:hypothetical protein
MELHLCRKMDRTGDHHVKWNKSDSERHNVTYFLSYMESRLKKENTMIIQGGLFRKK